MQERGGRRYLANVAVEWYPRISFCFCGIAKTREKAHLGSGSGNVARMSCLVMRHWVQGGYQDCSTLRPDDTGRMGTHGVKIQVRKLLLQVTHKRRLEHGVGALRKQTVEEAILLQFRCSQFLAHDQSSAKQDMGVGADAGRAVYRAERTRLT
jgi:hypothetical protein